jgi:hypothetical protein
MHELSRGIGLVQYVALHPRFGVPKGPTFARSYSPDVAQIPIEAVHTTTFSISKTSDADKVWRKVYQSGMRKPIARQLLCERTAGPFHGLK